MTSLGRVLARGGYFKAHIIQGSDIVLELESCFEFFVGLLVVLIAKPDGRIHDGAVIQKRVTTGGSDIGSFDELIGKKIRDIHALGHQIGVFAGCTVLEQVIFKGLPLFLHIGRLFGKVFEEINHPGPVKLPGLRVGKGLLNFGMKVFALYHIVQFLFADLQAQILVGFTHNPLPQQFIPNLIP